MSRVFELILALGIPTEIPRVGFTLETIFVPGGDTEYASVHRRDVEPVWAGPIRDNGIEFEFELNLDWLTGEQTGGWVESHFDIVDKFSPAARPTDTSVYTHKLNFELDTAFLIFNWLPDGNWLKHVEFGGIAGLRGHGVAAGGRRDRRRALPG